MKAYDMPSAHDYCFMSNIIYDVYAVRQLGLLTLRSSDYRERKLYSLVLRPRPASRRLQWSWTRPGNEGTETSYSSLFTNKQLHQKSLSDGTHTREDCVSLWAHSSHNRLTGWSWGPQTPTCNRPYCHYSCDKTRGWPATPTSVTAWSDIMVRDRSSNAGTQSCHIMQAWWICAVQVDTNVCMGALRWI